MTKIPRSIYLHRTEAVKHVHKMKKSKKKTTKSKKKRRRNTTKSSYRTKTVANKKKTRNTVQSSKSYRLGESLQDALSRLNADNAQLNAEITKLKQRLAHHDEVLSETSQRESGVIDSTIHNDRNITQKTKRATIVDTFKKVILVKNDEVNTLNRQLQAHGGYLKEKLQLIADLKRQNATDKRMRLEIIQQIEKGSHEKQKEINRLKKDLNDNQIELRRSNCLRQSIQEDDEDIAGLQLRISEKDEEISVLNQRIETLEHEIFKNNNKRISSNQQIMDEIDEIIIEKSGEIGAEIELMDIRKLKSKVMAMESAMDLDTVQDEKKLFTVAEERLSESVSLSKISGIASDFIQEQIKITGRLSTKMAEKIDSKHCMMIIFASMMIVGTVGIILSNQSHVVSRIHSAVAGVAVKQEPKSRLVWYLDYFLFFGDSITQSLLCILFAICSGYIAYSLLKALSPINEPKIKVRTNVHNKWRRGSDGRLCSRWSLDGLRILRF